MGTGESPAWRAGQSHSWVKFGLLALSLIRGVEYDYTLSGNLFIKHKMNIKKVCSDRNVLGQIIKGEWL